MSLYILSYSLVIFQMFTGGSGVLVGKILGRNIFCHQAQNLALSLPRPARTQGWILPYTHFIAEILSELCKKYRVKLAVGSLNAGLTAIRTIFDFTRKLTANHPTMSLPVHPSKIPAPSSLDPWKSTRNFALHMPLLF